MLSFRPQASGGYLRRGRLLGMLPDEPGFVVWLEAPYGYGKTILASQWADLLEGEGWRVVWTALGGREARAPIAKELGLPEGAPWGALLDALWQQRTLLVIEDLETVEDHEALAPLLRDVRGLLLLASRTRIDCSELPRLVTRRRLIHLSSAELGFSEAEARQLSGNDERASDVWRRTHGWPLPLHFALLAGDMPESSSLLDGMRASLDDAEWEEALLLATVVQLPRAGATPATERLARGGFAQRTEGGFRLHPLVGEALLHANKEAAAAVLKREALRLPVVERAEAFERSGLLGDLEATLEAVTTQLWRLAPEGVLRWDALLTTPASARRHVMVGAALKALGRHHESAARLEAALAAGTLSPDEQVMALGELCWAQAFTDPAAAARTVEEAEPLLDEVSPERAGRFLANAFFVDISRQRFDDALAKLERAMQLFPADSPYRLGAQINHALGRWDKHGDVETRLRVQAETLPEVWRLYPSDAPGQCRDLGMLHSWFGNTSTARAYFEEALRGARSNPLVGLEVEAALAAMDADPEPFHQLLSKAEEWGDPYTQEIITMHGVKTLSHDRVAAENFYARSAAQGGLAAAAYAELLAAHGETATALRLVSENLEEYSDRARRLYLKAARYRLTRDPEHLSALLDHTTAGPRLLPGLVSLAELPRDRPELSLGYPLEVVMASDWKEARELRAGELPDLELLLLGRLTVRLLGEEVRLPERQQQILTLFALGLNREEVAEAMWPESSSTKQRNNLGVQMSLLRKQVEPWGVRTYVFENGLKRVTADVTRLKNAIAARDAVAVLELYLEPLAPGMGLDAVLLVREQLREEVVGLLEGAAAEADGERAEAYLARILELEPLHERALQGLLGHLLQRGRRRDAHKRYRSFARLLEEEMGLEPLPETRELLREPGTA